MPPRRKSLALALVLALAGAVTGLLLIANLAGARKPPALDGAVDITVAATRVPLDRDRPDETRFGKLTWRGTLELTSSSRSFGGYSGLAVNGDGTRLVAVSDAGSWLTARIVYRGGRAVGLDGARIGPLRARDGTPLEGRGADAEAIAFAAEGAVEGEAYIAFERRHRIGVFPVTGDGVAAPRRYLPLPPEAKRAPSNAGLEAIAVLRAGPARGALLALSEEYLDEAGNHIGWLLGLPSPKRSPGSAQAGGPAPGRLTVRRIGGFAITGAAVLPDGDLVLLERRFRFLEGVKMRLRRIAAAGIRPGALLDGEVLLETDALLEIDNMEGLAVHRDAAGATILTLISDDNFNPLFQRTLLMQFEVP